MKIIGTILFWLWLVVPALANDIPMEQQPCDRCHGFPPGHGQDSSGFNAGAHDVHAGITCDKCHEEMGSEDHINGIVTILSSVGYENGTKISWPAGGGGACGGGKGNKPMPAGCHVEMMEEECFWRSGYTCKPSSTP